MSAIGVGPMFYRMLSAEGEEKGGVKIVVNADPWPEHIGVSHELLELADPAYISVGDGMLRFSPDEGSQALYAYAHEGDGPFSHWDLIRTWEAV